MAAPLMALPPLAALAALPSAFEDEPAALWPALAAAAQGQAADAMARLTEILVRQGCEKGLAGTSQALTALEALVQAGRSDLAARLLPLLHAPADSPPLSRLQAWLRGTEEGLARHAALFLVEAGSLSAQALPHLLALLQAGPDRSRYRAALALHARGKGKAYRVTAIGCETVEALAALERQHHADPQLGTVLDWALNEIRHDDPAAVEDWCRAMAADIAPPVRAILVSIHRLTPPVWPTLARYLAEGPPRVQEALLDSLSWLLREQTLPNEALSQVRDLLRRLVRAKAPAVRRAAVEALGCLAALQEADGQALLPLGAADAAEAPVKACALARLASRLGGEARASLEQALRAGLAEPTLRLPAAAGLIRLWLAAEKGDLEAFDPAPLLERLVKEAGLAPQEVLEALLLAGNDDDGWDNYHERVTRTLRALVVAQAEALFEPLLDHLETALSGGDGWPPRRIALAFVIGHLNLRSRRYIANNKYEGFIMKKYQNRHPVLE